MSKKAIVFGATSGIGKELAKLLVNDGYKVLVTGRRKELLDSIKNENPDKYLIRQHDITDLKDTEEFFKEIPGILETVDLIIHNAGVGENNFNLELGKGPSYLGNQCNGCNKSIPAFI